MLARLVLPLVPCLWLLLAAAPATADVRLGYVVYLGGLLVGEADVTAAWQGGGYRVVAESRTSGLADLLVGFVSAAESEGSFGADGVRPRRHQARNVFRGEARHVELRYGPAGAVAADVDPPPGADRREPLAEAATQGTLDPLSAGFAVWQGLAAGGPCAADLPVFDGRRRYDLRFVPIGPDRWRDGDLDLPSLACDVRLERIGGFSAEPWLPETRRVRSARLWFAQLPRLPGPVPARLESETMLGMAVVRLATVDGVPVAAAALPDAR